MIPLKIDPSMKTAFSIIQQLQLIINELTLLTNSITNRASSLNAIIEVSASPTSLKTFSALQQSIEAKSQQEKQTSRKQLYLISAYLRNPHSIKTRSTPPARQYLLTFALLNRIPDIPAIWDPLKPPNSL